MSVALIRRATVAGVIALILLGIVWELWLAPLRPGGTLLAFKVLPLAVALPSLIRGEVRTWQLWTMLILLYVCEGVVRAMSDVGLSQWLGAVEGMLASGVYVGLLVYVRQVRRLHQIAGAK